MYEFVQRISEVNLFRHISNTTLAAISGPHNPALCGTSSPDLPLWLQPSSASVLSQLLIDKLSIIYWS